MPDEIIIGAQAQDVAAPADTSTTPDPSATEPTSTGAETVDAAPQQERPNAGMPKAERAEFAAVRRRAEQQAQAKYQAQIDRQETYAKAQGFDSFEAMMLDHSKQKLASGDFTPDALAPFMQPLVDRAVQERVQQALLEQQADGAVREDMAAFLADYPDSGIKDVTDFAKHPYYETFRDYVSKGLTFSEAYELANRSEIAARRAAAAKQATLNSVNSKEHLQPVDGDGDVSTVVVPEETKRLYRMFNPRATDAEIKDHYAQSQKG